MCKKKLIPQLGAKLRELRSKTGLSQTNFAARLEDCYHKKTSERHSIQQSEICRLEREDMSISLKTLLAYTLVGNVSATELVNGHFRHLLSEPNGIRLHTFTSNEAADEHLYRLEKGSRILVSPEFPSSFFRMSKNSKRYQQFNSADYESMEIYTAESFLNFLFSPVSPYTLDDKTRMLEKCIDY
ncbi:MAG: helix-turn-helix transcriptional regulator [Thiolinea sp.]